MNTIFSSKEFPGLIQLEYIWHGASSEPGVGDCQCVSTLYSPCLRVEWNPKYFLSPRHLNDMGSVNQAKRQALFNVTLCFSIVDK